LLDVRAPQWDLALRTNAYGLVALVREGLGVLREPGARIVALSSLGGQRYVPFYGAVGASKAALEHVVRSLAVELAPRGIRVNAVSAGLVEGAALLQAVDAQALRGAVVHRTPANRLATPEEIAEAVLFLISERSRWIYGQTVVVDGGFSLV
jgi:enoyl-[acyl-carrier protein] reductase III